MRHTLCAICDTDRWDRPLYPGTVGEGAFTSERFSARRSPDRVHYRMVRCGNCGLIRSDPVLEESELARLYADSRVTYAQEAGFAGETYARYLREVLPLAPARDRLLEIGCGSGFFLERALDLGFSEVRGVEPSRDAVEAASPRVRDSICIDGFRDGLFPEHYFSVVCGFQVFDHLANPNDALQTCRRILRHGGLVFFVHHDAGAWTNRLLGERSPIVDVEHIYLYDRRTMARILAKNAFQVLRVFPVLNRYPIYYWGGMAPLPSGIRRALVPRLRNSVLGRFPVAWNAGNLGIVGCFNPEKA
jgi:SAM-dependent methyltransferase